MRRRGLLAAIATAGVASVAGCSGGDGSTATGTPTTTEPPGSTMENGSFEDGLTGWTVGRDLPTDPNAEGDQPVETDVTVTDDRASNGERSCALFIDGTQDDGTLWVQQEVDLREYDRLAIEYYSEQESFNVITKAATYTGPVPEFELVESDFDTEKAIEDHEGWKTYEYDVDHDGPGLVAVGISVVWETELTRFLDNVRLR